MKKNEKVWKKRKMTNKRKNIFSTVILWKQFSMSNCCFIVSISSFFTKYRSRCLCYYLHAPFYALAMEMKSWYWHRSISLFEKHNFGKVTCQWRFVYVIGPVNNIFSNRWHQYESMVLTLALVLSCLCFRRLEFQEFLLWQIFFHLPIRC